MKKSYKASVTIFLALVFMVVVSLLVTLANYVSTSSGIATIHMIDSMSIDSVFSEYDRSLFEEYGLLFLDADKKELSDKLMNYMTDNSCYNNGLMDFRAEEAKIINLYTAGGEEGAYFERQIFDYMKYAAPIDAGISVVKELLGVKEESPSSQAVDSLVELSRDMEEGAGYVYELMEYLDGVETEDISIVTDGMHVVCTETFGKAISVEKDPVGMGINSPIIYAAIEDKVNHPIEMLMELKTYMEVYSEFYDREMYYKIFDKAIEISKLFDSTERSLSNAYSRAVFVKSTSKELSDKSEELKTFLDENSENISEELREGIEKEIEKYKDFDKKSVNGICDIDLLMSGIERNKSILAKGYFLSDIASALDDKKMFNVYMEQLDELIFLMHEYKNDDLVIDYSGIDIFKKSDMSPLKSLRSIYDMGILYLVAGDTKLSDKYIPESFICQKGRRASFLGLEDMVRNVSFNEYVLGKFSSYTDNFTSNYLDYEVEYIIAAQRSDRENLSKVCSEIIGIRTVPNLIYLFTDGEKNGEAESLAALMVGGCGIPAVITAVKYAILCIWAYAESIVDVKDLLAGEKVPVAKNRETFNMSFEKLLAMDFVSDKKNSYGMKYEDFLRLLLFLENYGMKNNATMNLVDMHMIGSGNNNFAIRDMVCGADIVSKYSYNFGKTYIRSSSYSY